MATCFVEFCMQNNAGVSEAGKTVNGNGGGI